MILKFFGKFCIINIVIKDLFQCFSVYINTLGLRDNFLETLHNVQCFKWTADVRRMTIWEKKRNFIVDSDLQQEYMSVWLDNLIN